LQHEQQQQQLQQQQQEQLQQLQQQQHYQHISHQQEQQQHPYPGGCTPESAAAVEAAESAAIAPCLPGNPCINTSPPSPPPQTAAAVEAGVSLHLNTAASVAAQLPPPAIAAPIASAPMLVSSGPLMPAAAPLMPLPVMTAQNGMPILLTGPVQSGASTVAAAPLPTTAAAAATQVSASTAPAIAGSVTAGLQSGQLQNGGQLQANMAVAAAAAMATAAAAGKLNGGMDGDVVMSKGPEAPNDIWGLTSQSSAMPCTSEHTSQDNMDTMVSDVPWLAAAYSLSR
jgi:hypothetical protein